VLVATLLALGAMLSPVSAARAVTVTEVSVFPRPATTERLVTVPSGRILFSSGPGGAFGNPGPPGLASFDPATGTAGVVALPSRPSTLASAAGSIWLTTPTDEQWFRAGTPTPISRVDPQTGQVLTTIDVGSVRDLAASPDGRVLYVSRTVSSPPLPTRGEVVAIDTTTLAVSAPLATNSYGPDIGVASDGALWFANPDLHQGIGTATLTRRDPSGTLQTFPAAAPASVSGIVAGDHGDVWVRVNRGTGFPGTPIGDFIGHADPRVGASISEATAPVDDAIISTLVLGPDGGVWYGANAKSGTFVVRIDRTSGAQSAIPVPTAGSSLNTSTRSRDGASLWFGGFGPTTNLTHVTFDGDATVADAASVAKAGLQSTVACAAACTATATLTGPSAVASPVTARGASRSGALDAGAARAAARSVVYARTSGPIRIKHATKAHGIRLVMTKAGRARLSGKGGRIVSTLRIRIRQHSKTRTIVRTIRLTRRR
jgi:hypothetical protein